MGLGRKHIQATMRDYPSRYGERTHTGYAFLCLIALLAQFSLLFIHSYQVAGEERCFAAEGNAPCCLAGGRYAIGEMLSLTAGETSPHSHHNSCLCPVCQILLRSSNYLVPHLLSGLFGLAVISVLVRIFREVKIAGYSLAACSPRAPPDSF